MDIKDGQPVYTKTCSCGKVLTAEESDTVTAVIVDNEAELTNAFNNSNIKDIIVSGDITLADNTSYAITRKVNISGESGASVTCKFTENGPILACLPSVAVARVLL